MKYKPFKDIELSRLGMGNMRLPLVEGSKEEIDYQKAEKIIEYAMSHGINYYDTAYVYNGGDSEKFLGYALSKYPRDSYYLATKFNIMANPDYEAVFEEELKRLNTDHIDFYLTHCLLDGNVDTYLSSGAIEYFLKQKELGRIRYLGFSSHAGLEALEKYASHHQWDFAQLQINYFDWNYSDAAQQYEVLKNHNIPIMVMEPCRGGRLASLNEEAEQLLKDAQPDWSIASWAFRFVESLDQVQVVLSGMSNLQQIEDNVATFSDEHVLDENEKQILDKAAELFHNKLVVPCTGCRYCCEGCPMQINIPEYLKVYNDYKVDGRHELRRLDSVESDSPFDACIGCYACAGACPQGIDIPAIMAELKEATGR